jgi:tRNA wybutosine-synthesizing protein 1
MLYDFFELLFVQWKTYRIPLTLVVLLLSTIKFFQNRAGTKQEPQPVNSNVETKETSRSEQIDEIALEKKINSLEVSNTCCKAETSSAPTSCGNGIPEGCGCMDDMESSTKGPLDPEVDPNLPKVKIFYGTLTDASKHFAHLLHSHLTDRSQAALLGLPTCLNTKVMNIADYDTEDFYSETDVCVFVLPTYTEGTASDDAAWFVQWLEDARFDFRVSKDALRKMQYAVYGLGDSAYGENFCVVGKNVDMWLAGLGAERLVKVGLSDKQLGTFLSDILLDTEINILRVDQEEIFAKWEKNLCSALLHGPIKSTLMGEDELLYESSEEEENQDDELMDVEDMGVMAAKLKEAKIEKEEESQTKATGQFSITFTFRFVNGLHSR